MDSREGRPEPPDRVQNLEMIPREQMHRFRSWLLPGREDLGWVPFLWLFYLSFLFLPLIAVRARWGWLGPTLASIPVFLVLYFRLYRRDRRRRLIDVLPIALLSYLLTPLNPAAFTYLVFVTAAAPYAVRGLPGALLLTLAVLTVQAAEMFYLRQSPLDLAIAAVICLMVCVVNHFQQVAWSKNAALKLSQEEIRRLAAVAERERIGRDLHDLLGHTLSLVAVKSELAGKLIDRDRAAAAREIAGVADIAREALRQVRTAVTGIRSVALASELISAQALLQSSGVALTCRRDEMALPGETETALAMIVREAATNIQRHSGASRACIELTVTSEGPEGSAGAVTLDITDDGRGGATANGNGLTGVRERVRSLGGSLRLESPRDRGTALRISLPLPGQSVPALASGRPTAGAASVAPVPLEQPAQG